jgi:Sec-independent protein secretion pathway component TatC
MIPFKETALWQNLLEFSTRILTIVLCYVFCFLITTEYTENVLIILSKYFVQTPLNNYGVYFSYKNFLEGTNTIYSLSFYCTNLVIIPFILHQLYVFARKGLYSNERQLLFTILKYFYAFHSLFTIFFSEYLLPFMLSNLNELAEEFDFKHVVISFEPNLQEYLQLIKSLYL